ncbi:thiol reductant ABC exporter subunit CydC [Salinisphaera hydrothermalis]|uniref:Cysteine ABC transporter permease/ATP-binding protein CydC n=1 Tax=Salinisphaera hydrothermalis (strain C41B8) TaxID=1304275 RepID=A0A084IP12_SALHC|nr:thiol reductant ABC exporter subunit CydC [Salinisphaera hydrothermalis]KEZ78446.1 cysteine ABC transporter permease/ATP-binding protein CydC [Salinisphaera hydrothermalis C41B8]
MSDWRRLFGLLRPYRGVLALGIGLATLVIVANVALMALAGWFITGMALAGLGLGTINYFAPAAGIRGLAIVRTGGRYLERLITHDATLRVLSTLRVTFYARLEPLAPAGLQRYRGGDLLSRMRADIDTLDNFYLRVIAPTIAAALCVVVVNAFAAVFSPAVAMVNVAALLVAGILLPWISYRTSRARGVERRQALADLRATVADSVGGMGELWAFQVTGRQAQRIRRLSRGLIAAQRRDAWADAVVNAASATVSRLALWGALILAIPLVARGVIGGPELAMLVFLVMASFEAVAPLPAALRALAETKAAARRVFEIMDAEPAVAEPASESAPPATFDIVLRDVYFRYEDAAPWALAGADLTLSPGRAIGLVGPSGAGKTSVVNLLLRFWPYQAGAIEIGGVPIERYTTATLRQWFAVVAQHTHLFNATIADNLRIAAPEANDEQLHAALARAGLAERVARMPRGLDTFVGEAGLQLSGGEARRLAIARAVLKNAPILILDEPTEGLDPASEAEVLAALAPLMRRATTLVITHRPSVLRYVDEIAVIEDGRVIEQINPRGADAADARFWAHLRLA